MLPGNTTINIYQEDTNTYERVSIESMVKEFKNTPDILIMSYDGSNIKHNMVASTRASDSMDFICVQYGDNNSVILTPTQKIYDPVNKKYVKAIDINTSNNILTTQLDNVRVTGKHKIKNNQSSNTYTLSVTDDHCFFAGGVLIHNGE